MSDLKYIQHELSEMQITVRELQKIEDYVDADYTDVLTDIRWNPRMLSNRLVSLRSRK